MMLSLTLALFRTRPAPDTKNGEFFWIDDLADDAEAPTIRHKAKAREENKRPLPAGDARAGRSAADETAHEPSPDAES